MLTFPVDAPPRVTMCSVRREVGECVKRRWCRACAWVNVLYGRPAQRQAEWGQEALPGPVAVASTVLGNQKDCERKVKVNQRCSDFWC